MKDARSVPKIRRTTSRKKPRKDVLVRQYVDEGMSVREIAEERRVTKDVIFRCLREYGIPARTNARRSTLRQYDLAFLEAGIKAKGLRGFARELRIDKSALLRHVKIRKANN